VQLSGCISGAPFLNHVKRFRGPSFVLASPSLIKRTQPLVTCCPGGVCVRSRVLLIRFRAQLTAQTELKELSDAVVGTLTAQAARAEQACHKAVGAARALCRDMQDRVGLLR